MGMPHPGPEQRQNQPGGQSPLVLHAVVQAQLTTHWKLRQTPLVSLHVDAGQVCMQHSPLARHGVPPLQKLQPATWQLSGTQVTPLPLRCVQVPPLVLAQ